MLLRTLRKGAVMRQALVGAVAALAVALVVSSLAGAQTPPAQSKQAKSPWVYYPLDTVVGDGGPAPKRDLSGTWAGPGSTDAIPRGANAEKPSLTPLGQQVMSQHKPIGRFGPAGTNVVCGFTVSGSTGTEYLQGLANATGQFGYGTIDDATQLYIGSRDALDFYFKGNISELLIYDHALIVSDLQLVNSYLAGRSGVGTAQFATKPSTLIATVAGTNSVISWVAGYTGYILEGRTNMSTGSWAPIVTNPPNNQFTIPTTNRARFFRLHGQ